MSQPAKIYYSVEEYLRMEDNSPEKHEYFRGEIFATAGGSERHNLIASNALIEIGSQLRLKKKDCRIYNSDMRVSVGPDDLFTYPDASVICGEPEFVKNRTDIVTNPLLLIEVLSPSTERYDRSEKFELYRILPTFRHYLIIDQTRVYVEYHQKIGLNKWVMETFSDFSQTFRIDELDAQIVIANLYNNVKLPA